MNYLDAHNHLQHPNLAPHRAAILAELQQIGLRRAVVNGTTENDWPDVSAWAEEHSFVVPSYGLHPWYIAGRSTRWLDVLRAALEAQPAAGVGEIGLDRWIEGHDLADQTTVFRAQLDLAEELARPVTIHCVQAWGALQECLAERRFPRGFLIHAYNGSSEMTAGFIKLGAYFSFSPYFLHERKAAQREIFRQLPLDRVLVETDAPDLRPPDELNPRPLTGADGKPVNHPANIDFTYTELAKLRGISIDELTVKAAENFERLFG